MSALFFGSFIQINSMKKGSSKNKVAGDQQLIYDRLDMHHTPGNTKAENELTLHEKVRKAATDATPSYPKSLFKKTTHQENHTNGNQC